MSTPNMSLVTSTPLVTTGPAWANNVESNWNLLDTHDHSSGKGVQITPAGINVTTDFSFNNFSATSLNASKYTSLAATLPITVLSSVYAVNGNLYFNNGSGTPVQITSGAAVNVAGVGGITGMGGTSAAVTYSNITKTFTFTQDAGITASMDHGPITIRENILSANGVTFQSPAALAGNYSLTFFPTLPVSTKFVTLDATGNLSATRDVDNSTLEISGSSIRVKDSGITGAKLNSNVVDNSSLQYTSSQLSIKAAGVLSSHLSNDLDLPGTVIKANGKNVIVAGANEAAALKVVRVNVQAAGAVYTGAGITVSRTGVGQYGCAFTSGFTSIPGVFVSVDTTLTATNLYANVRNLTGNNFDVIISNDGGGLTDAAFCVMAIGLA